MKTIKFYKTKEPFGEFSNFASFPIQMEGKIWPTTEHYFQAQKFSDQGYQEKIRLEPSPMIAARLGRSRSYPIRQDWNAIRDEVMTKAVTEKVRQHEVIKNLLLSTKDAELIEQQRMIATGETVVTARASTVWERFSWRFGNN